MSKENPLIQKLRDDLAFSAGHKSDRHPSAEAVVITTQAAVKAAIDELELLRATPGGATEVHVLDNGSHVTGERAAELLDHEMQSHKKTSLELARVLQAHADQEFTARELVKENQSLRSVVDAYSATNSERNSEIALSAQQSVLPEARAVEEKQLEEIARKTALQIFGYKTEADLRYWDGVMQDKNVSLAAEAIVIALRHVARKAVPPGEGEEWATRAARHICENDRAAHINAGLEYEYTKDDVADLAQLILKHAPRPTAAREDAP